MNTPVSKESAWVALQYRDFRLFWGGNMISQIGSKMQVAAISWHIWQLTRDEIALGYVGLANLLPILFFSIWGGMFADRLDRKKVIIATQSMMMVAALILAFSTLNGSVTPWLIYLMAAVNATGTSFEAPARVAMIPRVVPEKHLQNALSLNMMFFNVTLVLGPALGGLILAAAGPGAVYLVNAITFIGMIINILLIQTSGKIPGGRSVSGLKAIAEGLRYIYAMPLIWSTMLLDFLATFFSSALLLLPVYADEILHVGEFEYGLLNAAPAVGAVITAYVLAKIGNFRHQGMILLLSIAVYGFATILFGLSRNFWLAMFALAITGAADTVSALIRNMIRQLKTPDELRGRMTGINMMFYMGGPQLGEFEAGWLASRMGAPFSVIFGGMATILMIGVAWWKMPFLRDFDNFEIDDSLPPKVVAVPNPQPASD